MYQAIYSQYIASGIASGNLTKWNIKCPFHDDSNPSAVVYLNTGIFHCATCGISLSPASFIAKLSGCTVKEADIIVSEFLNNAVDAKDDSYFSKSPKRDPQWNDLVELSQTLINPDRPEVVEYLKRKSISYETLIKAKIGWLPADKTNWKRDSLVFPYYIQRNVWGIRYRDLAGNKSGEPGTTFCLWGTESIADGCNSVILVEGETDRLTALEIFPEIPVVSTPTCKFKSEWKREFQDIFNIIVIPQDDTASENFIKSVTEHLQEDAFILRLPWKRGQIGKDLNDWRAQNACDKLSQIVESKCNSDNKFVLSFNDLSKYKGSKQYYINNLISPGQIVGILGPQKAKKSWMMFNLIKSLISDTTFLGLPWAKRVESCGKIIVVEEEGTIEDLAERAGLILSDVEDKDKVVFLHKKGVKLDNLRWIERLAKLIEDEQADVLCLDCFYNMHSKNEDKAAEMAEVWNNLHSLIARFPRLVIVLLHHFGKNGDIERGWNSIRGSSSFGAQLDVAIFQEKVERAREEIIRVKFDGRELQEISDENGNSILECCHYGDGTIQLTLQGRETAKKFQDFYDEMKRRSLWKLVDAAEFFGVKTQTIRNWVERYPEELEISRPAKNNPAAVRWKS